MGSDHARLQHEAEAETIHAHVVRDGMQASYSAAHQSSDGALRNATQAESTEHDGGARWYVGHCFVCPGDHFVHGVFSCPLSLLNESVRRTAYKRHAVAASAASPASSAAKVRFTTQAGRRAHATKQERQEVPGGDVHVVPRIFGHGMGVKPPGAHFAQREGGNIPHPQRDDESGVAKGLHLINLKWEPEQE